MTPEELTVGWAEMVSAYRDAWQRVFAAPQPSADEAEAVLTGAHQRMDEIARAAERSVAGRFTGADGHLQSELVDIGERMERVMGRIHALEGALTVVAGGPLPVKKPKKASGKNKTGKRAKAKGKSTREK